MPSLKKSIYNTEIKNILTQYKFLLFFHHNNIPSEEWRLLKTEISYFHDISIKVVKNKITYEILKKLYPENKQNMYLLCQGPNFIIGVNSIRECKNICKILNVQGLVHHSSVQAPVMKKNFNSNENTKNNTKLNLVFKKNEINTKNNGNSVSVPNFIFIGGLFEHKIINNLDLQKLVNLNNSVYTNLIFTVNSLTQKYLFLQNTNVMNLVFSLQKTNSLLHVLNVHKNNLIKEKSK